jgi:hypothetical protein
MFHFSILCHPSMRVLGRITVSLAGPLWFETKKKKKIQALAILPLFHAPKCIDDVPQHGPPVVKPQSVNIGS